jgi:23S rRNA A2030 N6-methylase RlmJ
MARQRSLARSLSLGGLRSSCGARRGRLSRGAKREPSTLVFPSGLLYRCAVANPYFGDIGDVWKHLAVSSLLQSEKPHLYYETHAGAACYAVSDVPQERPYDFRKFLNVTRSSPTLRESPYAKELQQVVSQKQYPGSPWLAMSVLARQARYVFVDVDGDGLDTIDTTAGRFGLRDRVECIRGDGPTEVAKRLLDKPTGETRGALALIDPFSLTKSGAKSLELFQGLADSGVRAVLWFKRSERERVDVRAWRGYSTSGPLSPTRGSTAVASQSRTPAKEAPSPSARSSASRSPRHSPAPPSP